MFISPALGEERLLGRFNEGFRGCVGEEEGGSGLMCGRRRGGMCVRVECVGLCVCARLCVC